MTVCIELLLFKIIWVLYVLKSIFSWVTISCISSLTFSLHPYFLLFLHALFLVFLKMQHNLSFLPYNYHTVLLHVWTTSSVSKLISQSINYLSPTSSWPYGTGVTSHKSCFSKPRSQKNYKYDRWKINFQGISQDKTEITLGPMAMQQQWS